MQDQEMKSLYRYKPTTLLALVVVLAICVTSCGAGRQPYTRGTQAVLNKDYETAMIEFKRAIDRQPDNSEYQLKYEQARFNAAFQHSEAGRRAMDKQDYETAKKEFTRVLEIDPTYALAEQQLAKINEILTARSRNEPEPEVQFQQLKQDTRTDPTPQAQLEPKTRAPIDVHIT